MTWLSEALADGADGIWLLDETSGTTAADSSGNSHPMTINGSVALNAAAVMPSASNSFDFPGSAGAYLSAAAAAWMADSSFSVEAWIRLDSTSSYRCIISRETSGTPPRQWSFYVTSGKLNMYTSADRLGTATLSTATVYHVAATYDSASSTLKYYIDGVLDTTLTSVTIPNAQTTSPTWDMYIGASQAAAGGANFVFDGRMGPIAYFPSALSGAQVAAHYSAGTAITITGTLAATLDNTTLAASGYTDAVGTFAATLDDTTLAASGTSLSPVTGTFAATLDDTTLAAAGEVTPVYDTDTSNALDGLDFGFTATVTAPTPVVAPPASKVLAPKYDLARALPVPTMVDGMPT